MRAFCDQRSPRTCGCTSEPARRSVESGSQSQLKQHRIFHRVSIVPRSAPALLKPQPPVKPQRRRIRGPHLQKDVLHSSRAQLPGRQYHLHWQRRQHPLRAGCGHQLRKHRRQRRRRHFEWPVHAHANLADRRLRRHSGRQLLAQLRHARIAFL